MLLDNITFTSAFTALLFAVVVIYGLWYLLTPKPLPNIPVISLPMLPILGHAHHLLRYMRKHGNYSGWWEEQAKIMSSDGKTRMFQVCMGLRKSDKWIVVADPALAEDILTRPPEQFERNEFARKVISNLVPTGQIVLPSGAMFKTHRRAANMAMSPLVLRNFSFRVTRMAEKMVELWKSRSSQLGEGECFRAGLDLDRLTMDSMCAIIFGESVGCLDQGLNGDQIGIATNVKGVTVKRFQRNMPEFYRSLKVFETIGIKDIFVRFAKVFSKRDIKSQQQMETVDAWIDGCMQRGRELAKARGPDAKNLADSVLDRWMADTDAVNMTRQEYRDELILFLIAGQGSSSESLGWCLKYLTSKPEVQRKLYAEIGDTCIDNARPCYDDVSADKMPYLTAIAWETLRLAKSINATFRQSMQDVTVNGHVFPKDTAFWFPTGFYAENSPAFYDNDGKLKTYKGCTWDRDTLSDFQPERWLQKSPEGDMVFIDGAGPVFPFGIGRRACVGRNMALMNLKLYLFMLCREFKFDQVPDELVDWTCREVVTRRPKNVYLRPSPWNQDKLS